MEEVQLEIFTLFTNINDTYNSLELINSQKYQETNNTQNITPWNNERKYPLIKCVDFDFFMHHNEDIVFIAKDTITFMIDHSPEKNKYMKIKVLNKHQNSRNYFRNTKNLKSINCTYTFEKDFFIILEKNYHIISCNNQWFFIKMNFSDIWQNNTSMQK